MMIKAAALDLKLQPENGFILKVHYICNVHLEWLIGEQKERERKRESSSIGSLQVVQLEELFHVRHSVFIVGLAGTGKTEVWKTLNRTYSNQKRKPHYNDLNPKAVTNDELFGVINPATREWKDGLEDNTHPSIFSVRSNALHAHISPSSIRHRLALRLSILIVIFAGCSP